MPGVLHLCNILKLIIHSFYNGSFSEYESVRNAHQSSFHVAFQFGNKLYSIHKQPLEEILANVPLVADQLTIYEIYKYFVFQWLTIINISRCYHKVEKFSFLVTNQVQFETEEPTHGAFSSLGYTFKNLMNMYSLVLADTQWCAVNKTYARALS